MKGIGARPLIITLIVISACAFAISLLTIHARNVSLADWYEGARGYKAALAEQSQSGKPMAIFFHADWCQSCKKLRETVLSTPEVKQYMSGFIRVKLEPEKEREVKILADKLGVIGFPTFFIIADKSKQAVKLMKLGNITPEQFIKQCKNSLSI